MIYSRKYSRNFIPLRQDNSRYTFDFRPALGRCLIEIKNGKGNVNFYAQGIKPNTNYQLELLSVDNDDIKIAQIGNFNVDNHGKGETKMIFDPDKVSNSNESIEKFNIVILMPQDDNVLSPALVGYIGSEVPWKDRYFSENNNLPINKEFNIEFDREVSEPCGDELTDKEIGLIQKEQGLIEREAGLIDKKEGLNDKAINPESKGDLTSFEDALQQKQDGLQEKADGLLEKENALSRREELLNEGNIMDNNKCIQNKENYLINIEENLINKEQTLIDTEKQLLRTNPDSEYEQSLITKEKELLSLEQNLLDREKELLVKEKGLLNIQNDILEKKEYIPKENLEIPTEKNTEFNETIQNIRKKAENRLNDGIIEGIDQPFSDNKDIEFINLNNAKMTPFKDVNDNVTWYRISPFELPAIINNDWKLQNNTFITSCYKKYKHLILGIDKSGTCETYTLGVPCVYDEDFHPVGDLKEFKVFMPVDSEISASNIKNGEYGYRLANMS